MLRKGELDFSLPKLPNVRCLYAEEFAKRKGLRMGDLDDSGMFDRKGAGRSMMAPVDGREEGRCKVRVEVEKGAVSMDFAEAVEDACWRLARARGNAAKMASLHFAVERLVRMVVGNRRRDLSERVASDVVESLVSEVLWRGGG